MKTNQTNITRIIDKKISIDSIIRSDEDTLILELIEDHSLPAGFRDTLDSYLNIRQRIIDISLEKSQTNSKVRQSQLDNKVIDYSSKIQRYVRELMTYINNK